MTKYETAKLLFDDFQKIKVRHRLSSYKGIGRPKKSDYVVGTMEEIRDIVALDMLTNGFSAIYINK